MEPDALGDGRGKARIAELIVQNFMLIFGAKPGYGVSDKTKLIFDVMQNFEKFYDRQTLIAEFPAILDSLKGTDTNIEIIQSSTLQTMKLAVNCYPMLISKCLIFVQEKLQRDDLEPIIEKDAKIRAETTKTFFEEDLEFDDV